MSKHIVSIILANTVTSGCVYYYIINPILKKIKVLESECIELQDELVRYKIERKELIESNIELNGMLHKYLNYEIV